jgi:hypothetical protein
MSAWMVTDAHVNVLVQAMINEGIVTELPGSVGRAMLEMNMRSLKFRYGDEVDIDRLKDYTFVGTDEALDDAIVYTQAKCYRYQACEDGDWWDSSLPQILIRQLIAVIEERLGGRSAAMNAAEDCPWGINDIKEAVKQ